MLKFLRSLVQIMSLLILMTTPLLLLLEVKTFSYLQLSLESYMSYLKSKIPTFLIKE